MAIVHSSLAGKAAHSAGARSALSQSGATVPLAIWLCPADDANDDGVVSLVGGVPRFVVSLVVRELSGPNDTVIVDGADSPRTDVTGTANLVVTIAPSAPRDAAIADDSYRRWAGWLSPGGILAVVTANPAGSGRFVNRVGECVAQAQAAGLSYRQHIIAVDAHIEGDRLVTRNHHNASHGEQRLVHIPAHWDVLVFAASTGGA